MTRTQKNSNTASVIARRLREARTRAGISQKTLGMLAGIDEFSASARVNQYERSKHVPDYATLEKFATILSVPTEFFYARDDIMAEMLFLFFSLPHRKKARAMALLKRLNGDAAAK